MPDGDVEVHLGVYGMTEALHRELQPLRRNVFDVAARLREAGVFFALNHLLHFYERQTAARRLSAAARRGAGARGQKRHHGAGAQPADRADRGALAAAGGRRLAAVAGSDAHTLRRVGTTWTEAPGRDRDEFLRSVRDGSRTSWRARRRRAGPSRGDAYGVIRGYMASLAGFGPRDHRGWRRAACLASRAGRCRSSSCRWPSPRQAKLRERREGARARRRI